MTSSTSPSKTPTLTIGTLTFPACNHYGRIGTSTTHPELNEACWFLQRSPLQYAITAKPKMSKFLLGNFWLTCSFDSTTDQIHACVLSNDEPDLHFDVEDVRSILKLPSYDTYEPFPLGTEHQEVVSLMNYPEVVKGPKSKGPGTLLRKNMGGAWNFLFGHIILCLSKKTGGSDQSPSQVTELAHALFYQRRIDYATYFFNEMISSFSTKRAQVPFHRFFSLIIQSKLAEQLKKREDIVYDLPLHQVGIQLLSKASLPSENPLKAEMIEFASNALLSWGENEDRTVRRRTQAAVPDIPTVSDAPKSLKRSKASGTSPSVSDASPKPKPSKKRRQSSPKKRKSKVTFSEEVSAPEEPVSDFTDFLYSDTTPWVSTSPVHTQEEVDEPITEESPQRHSPLSVSPTQPSTSEQVRSPLTHKSPSPPHTSVSPKSPTKSRLVDYSSSSSDDDHPTDTPMTSSQGAKLFKAFTSFSSDISNRVRVLEDQAHKDRDRFHRAAESSEHLSDTLKACVDELSVSHPVLASCLDMLHLDALELHTTVSGLQEDLARQSSDNSLILKNQEMILQSLASLHSKLDKVPTSPPSFELDAGDALFTAEDRFLLQRLERKVDLAGVNISSFFSSVVPKGSTTEGEKIREKTKTTTQGEQPAVPDVVLPEAELAEPAVLADPAVPEVAVSEIAATRVPEIPVSETPAQVQVPEAATKGEDVSVRTLESEEKKKKDKGKKPMTAEEILEEKRKKKRRDAGADTLRLQPPSKVSEISDPLGVILTDAEREEAIKAQLEYDQSDVLKIAQAEAQEAQVEDALRAQKDELENLKKQSDSAKAVSEAKRAKEVSWYKERINKRQNDARITGAVIIPPKAKGVPLLVNIKRDGYLDQVRRLDWLEILSITEWIELGNHLSKSKSKHKETVLDAIRKLFLKMTRIQKENKIVVSRRDAEQLNLIQRIIRGQPIQHPRNKKKNHFAMLYDQGVRINASGIDTSIPTLAAHPESTIITQPEYGIFFEDIFGTIGFFRIREIPIASISFLRAILGVPKKSEDGDLICRMILNELKKRETSRS